MDNSIAVAALAALAQTSRLSIFRLLVESGHGGLAAGEIGAQLGIPAATLSFHLRTLTQAGLLSSRRDAQFIYYAANFAAMTELIGYLTENCCRGDAGACADLVAATPSCDHCETSI